MNGLDLKKLGLIGPEDLEKLAGERRKYIIEDFMLEPSINLLCGHSGLGKSALCAQIAMSVATGRPFLGHAINDPGPVVYCDAESTPAMMSPMVESLAKFLGEERAPDAFQFWNPNWNINDKDKIITHNKIQLYQIVRSVKPRLVVLDSLRNFYPKAINDQEVASTMIKEMRKYSGETRCSWLIIHHLRKTDKEDRQQGTRPTVRNDVMLWLEEAAGTLALINNTDLRLGWEKERGQHDVLWLGGFLRVHGNVGPYKVQRELDEEGEPIGYRLSTPIEQLTANEQTIYGQLPLVEEFNYTYLTNTLNRSRGVASRLIKKCLDLRLLRVNREIPRANGDIGRPVRMYVKSHPDEVIDE